MKRLALIACLALTALPAYAADAPKPTVEELQKKVDDLAAQVGTLQAAVQGARQQRDQAASALADAQLQAAIEAKAHADADAAKAKAPAK